MFRLSPHPFRIFTASLSLSANLYKATLSNAPKRWSREDYLRAQSRRIAAKEQYYRKVKEYIRNPQTCGDKFLHDLVALSLHRLAVARANNIRSGIRSEPLVTAINTILRDSFAAELEKCPPYHIFLCVVRRKVKVRASRCNLVLFYDSWSRDDTMAVFRALSPIRAALAAELALRYGFPKHSSYRSYRIDLRPTRIIGPYRQLLEKSKEVAALEHHDPSPVLAKLSTLISTWGSHKRRVKSLAGRAGYLQNLLEEDIGLDGRGNRASFDIIARTASDFHERDIDPVSGVDVDLHDDLPHVTKAGPSAVPLTAEDAEAAAAVAYLTGAPGWMRLMSGPAASPTLTAAQAVKELSESVDRLHVRPPALPRLRDDGGEYEDGVRCADTPDVPGPVDGSGGGGAASQLRSQGSPSWKAATQAAWGIVMAHQTAATALPGSVDVAGPQPAPGGNDPQAPKDETQLPKDSLPPATLSATSHLRLSASDAVNATMELATAFLELQVATKGTLEAIRNNEEIAASPAVLGGTVPSVSSGYLQDKPPAVRQEGLHQLTTESEGHTRDKGVIVPLQYKHLGISEADLDRFVRDNASPKSTVNFMKELSSFRPRPAKNYVLRGDSKAQRIDNAFSRF